MLIPYQGPECCFKAKISSCPDRDMTIFRDTQKRVSRRVLRPRHVSRHPALQNRLCYCSILVFVCLRIALFGGREHMLALFEQFVGALRLEVEVKMDPISFATSEER